MMQVLLPPHTPPRKGRAAAAGGGKEEPRPFLGGRRRERNELLGGIAAAEEGKRRGETSSAYHFPLFLAATNCAEKGLLRREGGLSQLKEEREGKTSPSNNAMQSVARFPQPPSSYHRRPDQISATKKKGRAIDI